MSDIDRKRAFVGDIYPHRGWKKKVGKMSDAQVVAIFLREQAKAHTHEVPEEPPKEESDEAIPF